MISHANKLLWGRGGFLSMIDQDEVSPTGSRQIFCSKRKKCIQTRRPFCHRMNRPIIPKDISKVQHRKCNQSDTSRFDSSIYRSLTCFFLPILSHILQILFLLTFYVCLTSCLHPFRKWHRALLRSRIDFSEISCSTNYLSCKWCMGPIRRRTCFVLVLKERFWVGNLDVEIRSLLGFVQTVKVLGFSSLSETRGCPKVSFILAKIIHLF